MGTRGLFGFRKNGQDKLTYNHYDSDPSGLGMDVVNFCLSRSIDELNVICDNIELIDVEDKADIHYIIDCVSGSKMFDYKDFILNSLHCQYAYIINLDDNTLEFWLGGQTQPQRGNRYGGLKTKSGYYPCKLLYCYSLSSIPENVEDLMNELVDNGV